MNELPAGQRRESTPTEVTNRSVFAIAAPMTLSFLTVPLLGLVDTTVVGRFGDPALIAGLAVGAVTFDVVFTAFNFLRTGTIGFIAQAYGARDEREQQAIFWRATLLALVIGALFLPLGPLIGRLAVQLIGPQEAVAAAALTYMGIRFLGTPATLTNFVLLGTLLGRNRPVATLVLQTAINGLNIVLSLTLGLALGWNIAGVAWGTVIGEATVAVAGFVWLRARFDGAHAPTWREIADRPAILQLMSVNRDIMIRSMALMAAFFLFTRMGTRFGTVTLAANAVLLNFFLISSYFLDGLAAASEQLAGRAVGARDRTAFADTVKRTVMWGFVLSAIMAALVFAFGGALADIMTTAPDVRQTVRLYLPWAALTALTGVLAFQMDGVFIGATWSAEMRNMMLISLAGYLAIAQAAMPLLGNHGLWLSLNAWLLLRGLTLLAILPRKAAKVFPA